MMWFILIGIFCVLAVVGFFVTGRPFKFALGGIVLLIAIIFILVVGIVVWVMASPCSAPFTDHNSVYCQNKTVSNSTSSNISQQMVETPDNSFPMNNSNAQYAWYDQHNVAMAYRCYPSAPVAGCSAQDWAYAVYNDKNDSRGATLKQQADTAYTTYISQFPAGKCVTESGVKICDLSYSINKTYGDGTREASFEANAIDCVNVATGQSTQNQGNTVTVDSGNTYCASDLGTVYIDPTIQVTKHFNKITIDPSNSSYNIPFNYGTCIWTYNGGNASVPYVEVSNNVGPSSSFFGVEAFCKNGNNQVDIYSYQGN